MSRDVAECDTKFGVHDVGECPRRRDGFGAPPPLPYPIVLLT